MALQDLTPQLRTRMNRAERLAGLFVFLAAVLMAVAFAFYLVHTGKRRGWFINKVPYYCYVADATGLKVGDPVRLLGRDVGRIVRIETAQSDSWFLTNNFNVFVKFEIWDPYFGYILTDSRVRPMSTTLFGARYLEITRGDAESEDAIVTVVKNPRFEDSEILNDKAPNYPNRTNRVKLRDVKEGVWLFTEESPSLTQQAEQIVATLAGALPALTNQIALVLAQANDTASNANVAILELQPSLTRLAELSDRLLTEDGTIGRLLLTTNLQDQVGSVLAGMDTTLTNTTSLLRTSEQQLLDLTRRMALTLDNVALVTSNLSAQVNANSLVLGEVSSLVVSADTMIQGLRQHWFLRSAFKGTTNPPLESVVPPTLDRSFR